MFPVFVQLVVITLSLREECPGLTLPWPFSEEYLTTVARRSYELRMDPSDMISIETSHLYESVIRRLPIGRELELRLSNFVFGRIDSYNVIRYQRMISEWYQTLNLTSAQIMPSQGRPLMQSSDSTTHLPTPALQTIESDMFMSPSNLADASQVQSLCRVPDDDQLSQTIPVHTASSLETESISSYRNDHLPIGAQGASSVFQTNTFQNNNTLESTDLPQPSLETASTAMCGLVSDPRNPTQIQSEDRDNTNTADNSHGNGLHSASSSKLPSGAGTVPSRPTAFEFEHLNLLRWSSRSVDASRNPVDRQSKPDAMPQQNTGHQDSAMSRTNTASGHDTGYGHSTQQGSDSSQDAADTPVKFEVPSSRYGYYIDPISNSALYEEVSRQKIEEGIDIIHEDPDNQEIKDRQERRIFTDRDRKIETMHTVEQDFVQRLKEKLGTLSQGQNIQQIFDQTIQECLRMIEQIGTDVQYSSRKTNKFRDPRSLTTSIIRGVDSASTISSPSRRVCSPRHAAARLGMMRGNCW